MGDMPLTDYYYDKILFIIVVYTYTVKNYIISKTFLMEEVTPYLLIIDNILLTITHLQNDLL